MGMIKEAPHSINLLISSLRGGGAEGVAVNLANSLAERGWQVNLIVLHLSNAVYRARLLPKVNLVSLDVSNIRYSLLPLGKFFLKNEVETVVVFNNELTVVAILLRVILRKKIKIVSRNINTLSEIRKQPAGVWKNVFVRPIVDLLYKRVDHVVNQCKAMEQDLLTNYPSLSGRTSVIYNPVAEYIDKYAGQMEDNSPKGNFLLCVGRLESQKAFHYAIKAFYLIYNEFPGLRLKIIGEGSLKRELKEYTHELGVEKLVDFEGFHENLIPYYENAKVTLLTSLYEGFPNVLVESIRMGTPVVSFDCPSGPKEIVINGVNGLIVEYLNTESLAQAVKTILEEDFKRKQVSSSISFLEKNKILDDWIKVVSS